MDVIDGPGDEKIAHVDVIGEPDQTIDELRQAGLLSVADRNSVPPIELAEVRIAELDYVSQ